MKNKQNQKTKNCGKNCSKNSGKNNENREYSPNEHNDR